MKRRKGGVEAEEEVDVVLVVDVVALRLSKPGGGDKGKVEGRAGEAAKEGGADAKKWSMCVLVFFAGLEAGVVEVVVVVVDVEVVVVVEVAVVLVEVVVVEVVLVRKNGVR